MTAIEALTHNAVLHYSKVLSDERMEALIEESARLVTGYLQSQERVPDARQAVRSLRLKSAASRILECFESTGRAQRTTPFDEAGYRVAGQPTECWAQDGREPGRSGRLAWTSSELLSSDPRRPALRRRPIHLGRMGSVGTPPPGAVALLVQRRRAQKGYA